MSMSGNLTPEEFLTQDWHGDEEDETPEIGLHQHAHGDRTWVTIPAAETPEIGLHQIVVPEPGTGHLDLGQATPHLASIAESLHRLAEYESLKGTDRLNETRSASINLSLTAEVNRLQAQLDRILEICKPSTSKLANQIRAELEPEPIEEQPEPAEPVNKPSPAPVAFTAAESPAAVQRDGSETSAGESTSAPELPEGASVEEWRAYARSLGYTGDDVDAMNRSQIRTMLGLSHPGEEG